MRYHTHRSSLGWLAALLVIAILLAGCRNKETGKALAWPPPSSWPMPFVQPIVKPTAMLTVQPAIHPTAQPAVQPTPPPSILGSSFDSGLDLRSGPVEVPLELQIPVLNVNAPVVGVGLTAENVMDAPKGPIGDPIWRTAFWYRGSGIPGESGTAVIAGHVTDVLSNPEIFANLEDLNPGDVIIVHVKDPSQDIRFIVDQIKVYSVKDSSKPAVLTKIFGIGPIEGTGPQPAPDGLSHLTLITCSGRFANGQFNQRTVVFATRSQEEHLDNQ